MPHPPVMPSDTSTLDEHFPGLDHSNCVCTAPSRHLSREHRPKLISRLRDYHRDEKWRDRAKPELQYQTDEIVRNSDPSCPVCRGTLKRILSLNQSDPVMASDELLLPFMTSGLALLAISLSIIGLSSQQLAHPISNWEVGLVCGLLLIMLIPIDNLFHKGLLERTQYRSDILDLIKILNNAVPGKLCKKHHDLTVTSADPLEREVSSSKTADQLQQGDPGNPTQSDGTPLTN